METTTIKKDVKKEEVKPIPKGAIILSQNVTTDVEQIENGYLITKRTETKYKVKSDGYADWSYETKKWYSKEDPLKIDLKDKALSDAFEE
jgi:hypothetical protein